MKYKVVLGVLLIGFMLALTACGGAQTSNSNSSAEGTEAENNEKIVLRLAHEDPPDNQWGMGALHFAELVKEKTDGKVEIQIFDNGQLGHGIDNVQQLQSGTLEMTLAGSDIGLVDNFFKIFDLPYIFRDREHVKKVFAGPIADEFGGILEKHGLVCLSFWENGFRQITNNERAVVVPADLSGMKIRVPETDVRVATFKGYGANPTAMAFSELYTALQQGVVDAQENPLGNIWGDKLFEVQKYISLSNHVFTPIVVLISKSSWDNLSTDVQTALKEAAVETGPWQMDWIAGQEDGWLDDMRNFGCEINEVDSAAFIEASKPVWDLVIEELGPKSQQIIDEIVNTK